MKLVDPHGRHIHKLRVSLLDACNMKCLYCMPDGSQFLGKEEWVPARDLVKLVSQLVSMGIDEIRLTGGEPLLRPDFREIVKGIGKLPLKKFGVTTNAIHLRDHLPFLKQHNCQHINISLDSLNPNTHQMINKTDTFNKIFETILTAKEMGLVVKTNTVLLKNINHYEVENFLDFSADFNIEVRFLELMKIGVGKGLFFQNFMSAKEAIDSISGQWTLDNKEMPTGSTSFNFVAKHSSGRKAQVGFIASESQPFCGDCSRLRLTAKGELRPCLMIDSGPSLIGKNLEEILKTMKEVMALKPTGRIDSIEQPMYQIGG